MITGGVRDTEEITALVFPVFASNVCIHGPRKDPSAGGRLGEPIRIGDADVETGDTVVGDADGVVVVGADDVATVAAAARARVTAEREMLELLRSGRSTIDILGLPT